MANMHSICNYMSIRYTIHICYLLICCTNSRTFYTCFIVKMTLVLYVYIFSEIEQNVVERKTKMLQDVSYFM